MTRPNDIGGLPGFGRIVAGPPAEPPFHHAWEGRLFGMILATRGTWTIDMFRAARERDTRAEYLGRGYFENWLVGFERVLAGSGLVGPGQRPAGTGAARTAPGPNGGPSATPAGPSGPPATFFAAPGRTRPGRFKVGDAVRVIDGDARGHTRRPSYLHGHRGVIVADLGTHRFPDRSAEGVLVGQELYTVSFDARELWQARADGRGAVLADLWDPYLEPAA